MKRLFATALVAALAAQAFALGGEFVCQNECPLAAAANSHRAYGSEALVASAVARADLVREVERNLARI